MIRVTYQTLKEAVTRDGFSKLQLIKHSVRNGQPWPEVGYFVDLKEGEKLVGRTVATSYEEALGQYYQLVEDGARLNYMYFEPVKRG